MKRFAALLLLACGIFVCGCGEEAVPQLTQSVGVSEDTTVVLRGDVSRLNVYSAYVSPQYVPVEVEQAGTVQRVFVVPGDSVKKGDLLADTGREEAEKRLEDAEKELEALKKSWDYQVELSYYDIVACQTERNLPGADLELLTNRESQLQTYCTYLCGCRDEYVSRKEREVEKLSAAAEACSILAPCDGTVCGAVIAGQYYAAGDNPFYIAKENSEYILCPGRTELNNTTYPCEVRVGDQTYSVTPVPYTTDELNTMQLTSSPGSRFRVKGRAELTLGDSAELIVTEKTEKDALYLPVDAVLSGAEESYVYLLVDGEHVYTKVETGLRTEAYCVITSGVEEGDVVYVPVSY